MTIASVIQFDGPVDALVWKSPVEDFNSTTQLVVDETHEALVQIEGRTEIYAEGRHTLTSPNIPGAAPIQRMSTGGETPFKCRVFFVNKVHAMDILWGTATPIEVEDPVYRILIHVMMHGSIGFMVDDSMKFVRKFTGFTTQFNSDDVVKKFRGIVASYVKECIARIMTEGGIGYYGINAYLRDIGELLEENLTGEFEEYGIALKYFNIESIQTPDSDTSVLAQAKARQAGRTVEGYSWQQEQQSNIAMGVATNQGSMGEVMGAAAGFMVGGVMGGSVADIARNVLSDGWGTGGSASGGATTEGADSAGAAAQVSSASGGSHTAGRLNIKSIFGATGNDASPTDGSAAPNGASGAVVEASAWATEPSGGRCGSCNEPLAPAAKYCQHCGMSTAISCSSCGAVQGTPGAKFCSECGTKL